MAVFIPNLTNTTSIGAGTWTSSYEALDRVGTVAGICLADNAVQLELEWSTDGVTVAETDSVVTTAGVATTFSHVVKSRYVRIQLSNDTGTNTTMDLQGFFFSSPIATPSATPITPAGEMTQVQVTTTDATPVLLATIPVPTDVSCMGSYQFVARRQGSTNYAAGAFRLTSSNASGTVTVTSKMDSSRVNIGATSSWDVVIAASSTNFTISVEGEAYNIDWTVWYSTIFSE